MSDAMHRIGSDRIGSDRIGSDRIGSDRIGSDDWIQVPFEKLSVAACRGSDFETLEAYAVNP